MLACFFNCCIEEEKKPTLDSLNLLTRTKATLFSSFSVFCFLRSQISKMTSLFFCKGSTEIFQRGDRQHFTKKRFRVGESGTGSFPAHWHGHKWKQHIHFVQFALPSHMELACKRPLSTKLFLIKSPSSAVMINTN